MVAGAREELHDLINFRSGSLYAFSRPLARARRVWWIEGTAVYQVNFSCSVMRRKFRTLNFGGTETVPPDANVERVEAISPCTWNKGITQSAMSSETKLYVLIMLSTDLARFACVRGTILGLLVVPLVCRTRATSSEPGS